VRGLILRTLTDHHGASFKPVLANRAEAETDDWARQMAKTLRARVERDEIGPAEASPAEGPRPDDRRGTGAAPAPKTTGEAP
jgi:hypothetical protein